MPTEYCSAGICLPVIVKKVLISININILTMTVVMLFWANTTAYEASMSKHELLVNSMIRLEFYRFSHDLWMVYEVAPVARRKIILLSSDICQRLYWAEHARTVSFMII